MKSLVKALISAQEIAFENGLTTISEAGISKTENRINR